MPRSLPAQAAKNVSAADDDDHLHAQFAHFADLLGHVLHGLGRNADAVLAAQGFAAELEQDPAVFGFGLMAVIELVNVRRMRKLFNSPRRDVKRKPPM